MMESDVMLLPHPDSPTRATVSPLCMVKFTLSTAGSTFLPVKKIGFEIFYFKQVHDHRLETPPIHTTFC